MSSRVIDRPIFVVGCGRSGTTLLFQLLRKHPDLAPTTGYPDGEDHVGWNQHGACRISGLGHPDQEQGHTGYHYCLYQNEDDVTPAVIERMTAYYVRDVLAGDRRRRVINKCPHLSNKLRYVRAIFPDARFVHIVRDCLPVVASWMEIMKEQPGQVLYWPDTEFPCFWVMPAPAGVDREQAFRHEARVYPGGGARCLVDYWRITNRNIPAQLTDTPELLLTIRYEDLCARPRETLHRIARFCELPEFAGDIKDDYGRALGSANDKFKRQMAEAQMREYLGRADDVRRQFGYVPAPACEAHQVD